MLMLYYFLFLPYARFSKESCSKVEKNEVFLSGQVMINKPEALSAQQIYKLQLQQLGSYFILGY